MSRQRKKRSVRAQVRNLGGGRAMGLDNVTFFDGAGQSASRGIVYTPTLDTRKEINPYERESIMRKARWMFGNTGIGRRCTKGLADLIGWVRVNPRTTDQEWNRAVRKMMARRQRSRSLLDISGKFTWDTFQLWIDQVRFRDGDVLVVFTENELGQGLFRFYESHQLASPSGATEENGWYDGVRTDKHGRHLAYGIREGSQGKVHVVSARHARLYYSPERAGQVRGVSGLTHAVNNILDITETKGFVKLGIKVASLFGAVVTQEESKKQGAFAGFRQVASGSGGGKDGAAPHDPALKEPPQRMENVVSGGQLPMLEAGQDLKTVKDDRPGPNFESFNRSLIDDIAWGCGVPPAVLWDISGLTGPGVRYSLNEVERWVSVNRSLKENLCHAMYAYIVAKEIKAGLLRECKDPDWYTAVEWIPQASLTIDTSRDYREARDSVEAGLMSRAEYCQKLHGKHWEDVVEQVVSEQVYIRERCEEEGLDPDVVFGALDSSADGVRRTSEEVVDALRRDE